MPVPTTPIPNWANDATFATGVETGVAPTLACTSAEVLQGWRPGKVVARKLNWLFRTITQWLTWLESSRPNFSTGSTHTMTGNCVVAGGTFVWRGDSIMGLDATHVARVNSTTLSDGPIRHRTIAMDLTADVADIKGSYAYRVIASSTGIWSLSMIANASSAAGDRVTFINETARWLPIKNSTGSVIGLLQPYRSITVFRGSITWQIEDPSSTSQLPEVHNIGTGSTTIIQATDVEEHIFTGSPSTATVQLATTNAVYGQRKLLKNGTAGELTVNSNGGATCLFLPLMSSGYVFFNGSDWV